MNRKHRLLGALALVNGERWADTASEALSAGDIKFEGRNSDMVTGTVRGLIRVYEIRLQHCASKGINVIGIEELLKSLSERSLDDAVCVEPYLGSKESVSAFWGNDDDLIGCVTVLDYDPNRGHENLKFALGEK